VRLGGEEVAVGGVDVHADEDGLAGLEDLVVRADADRGEVFAFMDGAGGLDGVADEVVDRAEAEVAIVEEGVEEFLHAAVGRMADQDQGKGELFDPGFRDREMEEDLVVIGRRIEGVVKRGVGLRRLGVEELPADGVFPGEAGEGPVAAEGIEGEGPPLTGTSASARPLGKRPSASRKYCAPSTALPPSRPGPSTACLATTGRPSTRNRSMPMSSSWMSVLTTSSQF